MRIHTTYDAPVPLVTVELRMVMTAGAVVSYTNTTAVAISTATSTSIAYPLESTHLFKKPQMGSLMSRILSDAILVRSSLTPLLRAS